jgi:hypothetical protein
VRHLGDGSGYAGSSHEFEVRDVYVGAVWSYSGEWELNYQNFSDSSGWRKLADVIARKLIESGHYDDEIMERFPWYN